MRHRNNNRNHSYEKGTAIRKNKPKYDPILPWSDGTDDEKKSGTNSNDSGQDKKENNKNRPK